MMMTETLMDLFSPDFFPEQGMPEEGAFDAPLIPDAGFDSAEPESDSPFEESPEDTPDADGEVEESHSEDLSDVDADADDHPDSAIPDLIDESESMNDVQPEALEEASMTPFGTELAEDTLGKSVFDPIFDFVTDVWDRFFQPFFDPDDIVHAGDFSENGMLDTKNHLVVVGDVASDINFVSKQTGPTCSLMAQEQFVHRLTGKPIPEEYLEWQAEKWRVYSPEIGTIPEGQDMILDHFNIPYDRCFSPDLDDIVKSMSKGNDVLVGVDARVFYQDPSIPPDSGHAVALVGRGLDPATGDLKGFYVTDSNFPGGAHFITTEQFAASWDRADMISVPEKLAA